MKGSRPVRQGLGGFATGVIAPKLPPEEAAELGPRFVIGGKESGTMTPEDSEPSSPARNVRGAMRGRRGELMSTFIPQGFNQTI